MSAECDAEGNHCKSCSIDDFNSEYSNHFSDLFNICAVNIRSCRKNFSELQVFLNSLKIKYKVIILTEIWLTEATDNGFNIEGFMAFNMYRSDQGGGVKVYVHKSIKCNPINEFCELNKLYETVCLELIIDKVKLALYSIYRPPSFNVSQFNQILYNNLRILRNRYNKVIIAGDININLLNPLNLNSTDEYVNNLISLSFTPHITLPTRYSLSNPITPFSVIDHIWSNFDAQIKSIVFNHELSDHLPTMASFKIKTSPAAPIVIKTRTYNDENINYFKNRLTNLVSNTEGNPSSIDNDIGVFVEQYEKTYFECFPLKNITLRKYSPWINKGLKFCIEKKSKLFTNYRHGHVTKQYYRNYCNLLTSAIRKTKFEYYQNKFSKYEKDQRKLWENLNKLKGMPKRQTHNIDTIKKDETTYDKPDDIAVQLNDFFTNIADEIRSNQPTTDQDFSNNIPNNPNTFYFHKICSYELEQSIKNLKNKKENIYNISVKILKQTAWIIANKLSELLNTCVSQGTYPSVFKIGKIIPIYKKRGDKSDCSSYRPITLLPIFNKIFEKIIHVRIVNFVTEFKIIDPQQFGFQKRKSVNHAIMNFIDKVLGAFSEKSFLVACYLDFKKAFDCVDHKILIHKLSKYGIRGIALKLNRVLLNKSRTIRAVKQCKFYQTTS